MSYKCEDCKEIIPEKITQFLRKKYRYHKDTDEDADIGKDIVCEIKVCMKCYHRNGEEII